MNAFLKTARKAAVLAAFGIIVSCSNSVDSMIDNYNDLFAKPTSDPQQDSRIPGPGDDDFVEEEMLGLYYALDYREKLYLAGPPRASTYVWTIEPILTNADDDYIGRDVEYTKYEIANSRYYTMTFASCSIFERGKSYKLSLTVTDNLGKTYSDEAVLTITAIY